MPGPIDRDRRRINPQNPGGRKRVLHGGPPSEIVPNVSVRLERQKVRLVEACLRLLQNPDEIIAKEQLARRSLSELLDPPPSGVRGFEEQEALRELQVLLALLPVLRAPDVPAAMGKMRSELLSLDGSLRLSLQRAVLRELFGHLIRESPLADFSFAPLKQLVAGAPRTVAPPAIHSSLGEGTLVIPDASQSFLRGAKAIQARIAELRSPQSSTPSGDDPAEPNQKLIEVDAELIALTAANNGLKAAVSQRNKLVAGIQDTSTRQTPNKQVFESAVFALDPIIEGLLSLQDRFFELAESCSIREAPPRGKAQGFSSTDVEMQVLGALLAGYPSIQHQLDVHRLTEQNASYEGGKLYVVFLMQLLEAGPLGITKPKGKLSMKASPDEVLALLQADFSRAFPDAFSTSNDLGWQPDEGTESGSADAI